MRSAVAVAALTLVALAAACRSGDETAVAPATVPLEPTTQEPATTTASAPDLDMVATDFTNITAMTPVEGFYLDNRLGRIEEALAVARGEAPAPYPVGTILQLFPSEAMVKRAPGFSPSTGDWEFFLLEVSERGTVIAARGPQTVNGLGVSCVSCHALAHPESDFVCHGDDSCPLLTIDPAEVVVVQDQDPRPH